MKYTNRADLLIAAGESIKMQESAGIEPMCKTHGKHIHPIAGMYMLSRDIEIYEFPIAVVEGKPVFVGDELWTKGGCKFIVGNLTVFKGNDWCSWNPPKPKTVMVELPIDIVELMSVDGSISAAFKIKEIESACRKALEK